MHTTKPFFLSVGIHTALIALLVGGLSMVHKKKPSAEEKIVLKLLIPAQAKAIQALPPKTPQLFEPQKPAPIPKAIQPHVITPPKIQPSIETAPVPKAVIATPQPPAPAIVIPKKAPISEPIELKAPVVQPKEQPPKHQKEEYVYGQADKVQEILNQRKKFPKIARNLKQYGEVIVGFDFTPNGEANNIRIIKSSGYDSLDDAAKELIKTSVSLFPKPQENVPISVPIEYMR